MNRWISLDLGYFLCTQTGQVRIGMPKSTERKQREEKRPAKKETKEKDTKKESKKTERKLIPTPIEEKQAKQLQRKQSKKKRALIPATADDDDEELEEAYQARFQKKYTELYKAFVKTYGDVLDSMVRGIGGDDSVADFAQFCLGAGFRISDIDDEQWIMDIGKYWNRAKRPEGRQSFEAGRRIKKMW
jgi:hypothetical protein